jgi:anti-anti-sigma factor
VTTVRDGSPGRAVVEVVGEVDAYTAPALDACLRSQSEHRGIREVVVDLSDVRFLGAAGMHVLARAGRRCRMRGARLVILTGGRRTALRPLQLTGLTDLEAVDPSGTRRGRRDAHSAASDPASSVGERSAPGRAVSVGD